MSRSFRFSAMAMSRPSATEAGTYTAVSTSVCCAAAAKSGSWAMRS
jgi:hypothetical protein